MLYLVNNSIIVIIGELAQTFSLTSMY